MGKKLEIGLSKFDLDKIDFIYDKYYDPVKNRQYISFCSNGKEHVESSKIYGEDPTYTTYTFLLHNVLVDNDIHNFAYLKHSLVNMDRITNFNIDKESPFTYSLNVNFVDTSRGCLYNGFDKTEAIELYNELATQYNSYQNADKYLIVPAQKNDGETEPDESTVLGFGLKE